MVERFMFDFRVWPAVERRGWEDGMGKVPLGLTIFFPTFSEEYRISRLNRLIHPLREKNLRR